MCKLKQDVQDSRISRIRVLEKSTARMQDTFSRARALSSKKRAGDRPPRASRTGQDLAILHYRLLQRDVGRGPVPRRVSDYRSPRGIAGDRPPRYGARAASRGTGPRAPLYFACFTSPNVVNARCAGDTGPRNRRVINVSRLPPNETSSIW